MDAAEAADHIRETAEEREEEAREARERFRSHAALAIAVVAAILAVCELGGDNAKNKMVNNNIKASDTWAFYQAKNMRQTEYKLAAEGLRRATADPALPAAVRAADAADAKRYDKTATRYEDDPAGDGKKQLEAKAKRFEEARDLAGERNEFFDYAQMLLQLAVVLGSVSILALSRPLLLVTGLLGAAGLALVANGFLLLVPMPG
jgi:cell division protein ZapA (FtsZ GTPase activity inhibitor)